ncbi:hypothetical protein CK203_084687 [Vitis vinifera]|uniref:DUF547 domain-containing protein n=1 Tax=Vitis vinifera TaxID=29760 RepID=A0A438EU19_VITVI|nr:hypothetical protein CK203_084687 [Vitis vinifera]
MLGVVCHHHLLPLFLTGFAVPSSAYAKHVTDNPLPLHFLWEIKFQPLYSSIGYVFEFDISYPLLLLTQIGQLERTLSLQSSLCWDSKKAPSSLSNASIPSNGAPTPKSPAQLIDEIATLEAGSPLQVLQSQPSYKIEPEMWRGGVVHSGTSSTHGWADSDDWNYAATSKVKSRRDGKNGDLGHHSLGEYFGASHIDHTLHTPDKLSEDIVQCISSIYCKLANPHSSSAGFSVSSTSSLSSTSTFSVQNLFDTWSPHCNEGATGHHRFQGLKEENAPYAAMVEVMKLCLDDDSFNYAASMLQNFRSLVQNLAKVNPRKMKREGKLAFWINIHNALVMHAYLAYGIRNCVKGTSILKAAYNVGGHCVNAYDIQSSILGIRSHRPAPWLQTLLSPGNKSRMGNSKHIYAIEYPEPLVHFALCSGTYSDPVHKMYSRISSLLNRSLLKPVPMLTRNKDFPAKDSILLCKRYVTEYAQAFGGGDRVCVRSSTQGNGKMHEGKASQVHPLATTELNLSLCDPWRISQCQN